MMRRRLAIALSCYAILLQPFVCAAQQLRAFTIGVLVPDNANLPSLLHPFRDGLRDIGYIEGENTRLDIRSAEGNLDRLPQLARGLIGSGADVLVTLGTPATLAAARATSRVPIVMVGVGDPVAIGVAASPEHPGRNVTGLSLSSRAVIAQRLQVLQELVPGLKHIAVILRNEPGLEQTSADIRVNAHQLGVKLLEFEITTGRSLDLAFMYLEQEHCDAMYVASGPLGPAKRGEILRLAARARLPVISSYRVFALEGGLVSYAPDMRDLMRRSSEYLAKILKGADPADIPIEPPIKFDLVVNLKTARELGLLVPESILARATETIE
jgi:ABC-type uncharacterized transport system substrate-binding protein